MERLSKLITKADFVGIQLKPTLNGKNRIKSLLGGLISLVSMTCILFGFIYFGISMIKKDRPIMNIVQERRSDIEISPRENPFMMIIYDQFGRIIHDNPGFKRAVSIKTVMYQIRPDPKLSYTVEMFKGTVKHCDTSQIDDKVFTDMESVGHIPKQSLCTDISSFTDGEGNPFEGEVFLRNRYGDLGSNYIHHKLVHCDEQLDPGCGDYLKTIGKVVVIFYKLNYYVDQTDYENPVKTNIFQAGYSISNNFSQSVYIPTRINEIVTDSSMFLTDEKKETYYTTMNPRIAIAEYKPTQRVLLDFVISGENIVNINQRRYMKIPELLANMGGLMKAAMAIGNLLSYFYSEYVYYLTVEKVEAGWRRKMIGTSQTSLSSNSLSKSAVSIKKSKQVKTEFPSFLEYLSSFINKARRKKINKRLTFRFLELNYLIDCLLFVEDLKNSKHNNFVKEPNS